jgi:hypothetical protein
MSENKLKNSILIKGEVVEKKITRKEVGTANEFLSMTLKVQVGEAQHNLQSMSYKYKKVNGQRIASEDNISGLWKGHDTNAKELIGSADENNESGKGSLVEIDGALEHNMYVPNGQSTVQEGVKLKGTFFRQIKDISKYSPCAVWAGSMHIIKLEEDVKDELGELYTKIVGILYDYKPHQLEFRVYGDGRRGSFANNYSEGDVDEFEGDIVCNIDSIKVESDKMASWEEEMDDSASQKTKVRRCLTIRRRTGTIIDATDEEHPLSEEQVAEHKKTINKFRADVISKHEEKEAKDKVKNNTSNKSVDPNVGNPEEIPF